MGGKEEKDAGVGVITAVYKANLHCPQCARDIKTPLLCTQGVHYVEINMEKGEIKAKGNFDPIKVQKQVEKVSKRKIQLISPTKENIQSDHKKLIVKEISKPAISRTTSVKVHMHCDQCERDLKQKLLKERGIHGVKTDMETQILTVDGTIEHGKLIALLGKKGHKHAEIVAEKKEEKMKEIKTVTELAVKTVESYKEDQVKVVEANKVPKDGDSNTPYFIHYVYAPQLFSDENPNACTVS